MSSKEKVVPRIDPDVCDGCGRCVEACPSGALAVRNGTVVFAEGVDCPYCGQCEDVCDAGAIARVYRIEFEQRTPPETSRPLRGGA